MNDRMEKPETSYEGIKKWLDNAKMRGILARTLPQSVPVEPWIHVALATIRRDSRLMYCDKISLMGAFMIIAGMGLRLEGVLGQAYIEPFNVKEKRNGKWVVVRVDAQVQIGYKGFIDLAYRIPGVVELSVSTVRRGDHFEFMRGTNSNCVHQWDHRMSRQERGKVSLMFSALRYTNGFYSFSEPHMFDDLYDFRIKVLGEKGIRVEKGDDDEETFFKSGYDGGEKVMDDWSKSKNPWINWVGAMYRKTVIRWDSKFWNLSPDFHRAAQLSTMADAGVPQNTQQVAIETIPDLAGSALAAPAAARRVLAPAQSVSLASSRNLAEQMAREAGVRKGTDKPASPGSAQASKTTQSTQGAKNQQGGAEADTGSRGGRPSKTSAQKGRSGKAPAKGKPGPMSKKEKQEA
ncbi:MAG: recombinase RecT, partial [Desulfobacteraceae bacterium]|nr:recombinase RecT [Desulfobacteraceae bacterium]